jgi:hypothetical protein
MFRKNSWSSEYHKVQVEVMSGAVRRSAWVSKMSPEAMFRRDMMREMSKKKREKGDKQSIIGCHTVRSSATFGGLFTCRDRCICAVKSVVSCCLGMFGYYIVISNTS